MKRVIVLFGLMMGMSFVRAASVDVDLKPPTEAQGTELVSAYANAWIAGDVEKMYASLCKSTISFADFKARFAHVVDKDQRPVRLAGIGKPYLARTPMLWTVDYALEFKSTGGASRMRYYQGLIESSGDTYGLRASVPYFAPDELEKIRGKVNEFLSNWKQDYSQAFKPALFATNKTQKIIHAQFTNIAKQLHNTVKLQRIQGWTAEPIEYLSRDLARAYVELLGCDVTLQMTLLHQEKMWRLTDVTLSAPIRIRNQAWQCVHAYLSAWIVGDAQGMCSQFNMPQDNAQHVFGYKVQKNNRPVLIQTIHSPVFLGKQAATVEYECLFGDVARTNRLAQKRRASLQFVDGRWCLDADQKRICYDDEQSCKQLLDCYAQSWILGDADGMQRCFVSNLVSVAVLEDKIRREVEKPKKLVSRDGMSINQDGSLEIYFTMETTAGTPRYTARFACDADSRWKISSVALRVPQDLASQLQQKVREYVVAWMEGVVSKMFLCLDKPNMTEAEFSKVIHPDLMSDSKPTRLEMIGVPRFDTDGGIRVPYIVSVMQNEQREYVAVFACDKERQKWSFIKTIRKLEEPK